MGKTQIHFWGPINIATVESFRNMLLNALKMQNCSEIEILFSSEGGDLNSGFTAYNYLRSIPVKTTIINMGTVESIAMIAFLGADERRAVKNARFLLHNFTWTFPSAPVDANRLSERNESLKTDMMRYANIFKERTSAASSPIDAMASLTGTSTIIGVDEAAEAGIITSVDTSFPELMPNSFYDRMFK